MKNLNFLRKRPDCNGIISTTEAQWKHNGSTMKAQWLRFVSVLVLILTLGVGNAWGTQVTYTISSKNTLSTTGTAPTSSSATIAETYGTSKQMTGGNSQTLTLKNYGAVNISNITLSMKSNSSSGAGKLSYSTDGGSTFTYLVGSANAGVAFNQSAWNGAWSGSYTNVSKDISIQGVSGKDIVIKIEATANSLFCQSYKITYTLATPRNVDWYVGDDIEKSETNVTTGTPPTVLDGALGGDCSSLKFVGWSETSIGSTGTTKPLDLFKGTIDLSANKTYYAVFAEQTAAGSSANVTYTISSKNTLSTTGTAPTSSSATIAETYNTSKQMTGGNSQTLTLKNYGAVNISNITLSMKSNSSSGAGKLSYSTDGGSTFTYLVGSANAGVAFNQSAWNGAWSGSYTNVSKDISIQGVSGKDIVIKIEATANSLFCQSYKITYTTEPTYATSSYVTTCTPPCTELAQINGSFSWSNVSPTSVTIGVPSDYTDKSNENLTGYIFKRYAASTGGSAVETIETNAADKTTATFSTGLVANTTYYYTIIAKHSSSSCNSAETSPRKSHKIDSYVVSYANGGGSGTNPGAHNPVLANGKVELKTNTFDAPTGKGFVNWSDGSNSYDEGEEYTVTANTTMTAQWECLEPGFTKNLSTAQVDYLQGETAAKLSVTAAANGAELSYQWQMSPNGTSGWDNVGSNSNEYTPSTATAGHQYYHCIVTNLVDGCTDSKATSAVAHIHVDVPAACLQPSISVASGTYYEDKTVTITCGTVGAAIYYTTDGSTTPTSGSTLYEGAITVDHSMTIKAIAIKAGMDNSTVAEATYTIKCETPTIVLAAGNYTGVQTTTITKGYGTKIYYTTDGSTPSNTNGEEYEGPVSIDQPMTLKAIVWKDGCSNSEVASAAYTLKCTTPEFNKGTDTYTGAQSITLIGTADADIYYTTDGTTPSKTNGTKYTAAIEVSANQTVKAIAVKEGWGDSEIASATYTIQYHVYWWVNGVAWTGKGGSTLVTYGQTATAPTTAPTKANGCGDKFVGWTKTQNYENDNTAPVDMFTETSAAITKETNFYAVFADYGEDE